MESAGPRGRGSLSARSRLGRGHPGVQVRGQLRPLRVGPVRAHHAEAREADQAEALHGPEVQAARLPATQILFGACVCGELLFSLSFNSPGRRQERMRPKTLRCCPLRRKLGLQAQREIRGQPLAAAGSGGGRRGEARSPEHEAG